MQDTFPQQLLKLRTEKQLSQTELARRLYVSRQAVSKWENGDADPSIDKLILLARIFKVSLDYLILGIPNHNNLILQLKHVAMNFNTPVLKDVSLSIFNNERIALLGSNGAGKTTLVRIIENALTPTSGTIEWQINKKDFLNIMPQNDLLIPALKVKEQVALATRINKVHNPERINRLLERFNLKAQQNTLVAKLSGGQKRRLSLIISTLRQSKLLILDEPTVGMDLESIDYFWQFIDQVTGSIMVITHDFNQIDKFFSRVLLLKDGQISHDISVKEIHQHNQTIEQWYRQVN
ncbi:XRE family transcriptional regulator [Limosilactobacillus walteri]|uniref:XRE family transcriptional regulator n=1 Tax=Limosilactobacillus walteri TaxID=2268022 RepID=A0ABR8P440_9LACO|nr:XRE family transcriptional regulator [Limosilactobacillus walteri]MBD5805777.1 XRE family transcriptional regulator [Limosilactobacillus walteri]